MTKTDFEIGELIEQRYRVVAPIGAGGMGKLYRVADMGRSSDEVALKMVKLNLAGIRAEYMLRQFQREFQLLTQLQHPNLVDVYNYGATTGGDFFYTMEFIEGQDLVNGMQDLSLKRRLPIMVQICRALGYLHAREVMHGDLKPANVLLSGEQVKIVDFGLAHDLRFDSDSPAYITPFYAAPEVGKGRSVDGRADLYSLGAMLYEGIVGEAPAFMVGAERLIRMTLRERLASQASIPAGIDEVVLRLLAQDPNQRYSNANQVIEALNITTGSTYELETRETASSYALRASFLGREAEIESLRSLWEQASKGQTGLVLIGGESGVGKTRLVEELEVEVELSGARVVWGQCLESGGSAYQPWREVLRVLLRYVESVESLDLKRVGPVLATIMPSLWDREYMAELSPPAELEPQAARQRLNDAILQVLQAAAGLRQTLVVIDDAHWGDEATLEMIRYLGRVLGTESLLVCVTYRSDEVTEEHGLVRLSGDCVRRIPVQNLSPELTRELVRSMLGLGELSSELAQRVQDTTGGNTFFVQELIRSLAEEGQVLQRTVAGWQVDQDALQAAQLPGSIQQVVWRRLEQLSEGAQQVLHWAAVVGPLFWEGAIAAQVGDADADTAWVREALSEARERELVVERSESSFAGEREYLFVKPAMQQVSYESLTQEQRQESHARVAEWLLARADEQVDEHLGLIVEHLQGAGQTEQAVIYLRRAGEQAAAQYASAEAIGYFSRALALIPEEDYLQRYDLLLAREKTYDLQGERKSQAQDLIMLNDLAETLDDLSTGAASGSAQARQTEIALRQASFYEATSNFPAAIRMAQQVVRLARDAQDIEREAAGYQQWGVALRRLGQYEAARQQLEDALKLAQGVRLHQVSADSLRGLGTISLRQGSSTEARAYQQQALQLYRQLGDRQGEGLTLNGIGITYADQGHKADAMPYFEQFLQNSREIVDRLAEAEALHNVGLTYAHLGDYVAARAIFEQALRLFVEVGERVGIGRALSSLGWLCNFLGDAQTALQYIQRSLRIAHEIGAQFILAHSLTILGNILTGLGRLRQAADAFRQAVTLHRELGQHNQAIEPLAGLAGVALAQGDHRQARTRVDEILGFLELEGNTLDGIGEHLRIYLTCYRVLQANQDPRAEAVLHTTYELLSERADQINDAALRQSFLENVIVHRELIDAFNQTMKRGNRRDE